MRILITAIIVTLPLILCGLGDLFNDCFKSRQVQVDHNLDCTNEFKNRIASFEYKYYQGYWMYPYSDASFFGYSLMGLGASNAVKVKSDTDFQWIMHDCSAESICMESKRDGWKDYFIASDQSGYRMVKDTDLSDGSSKTFYVRIFCDSCEPGGAENSTYSNCQIINKDDAKAYASKQSEILWCCHCGDDSWFRWRIEAPPSRVFWNEVYSYCNTGDTKVSVKHTVKSSITTSTTTTETHGFNAKITLGKEVAKYAGNAGGELGYTFSKATTNMKQLAQEATSEASAEVGPGERWVVRQMVGQAGWTSVNTLKFKSEKTRCGPEPTTTTTSTTPTTSTTSTTSTTLTTSTTASTTEKNTSVKSDKNSSGPKPTTSTTASTAEKSSVTFCYLILLMVFLNLSPSL